jgi:hypothetical protein
VRERGSEGAREGEPSSAGFVEREGGREGDREKEKGEEGEEERERERERGRERQSRTHFLQLQRRIGGP